MVEGANKKFTRQYTQNVTKELNRSLIMLEKDLMDLQKLSQTSIDNNFMETLLKKKKLNLKSY